MTKNDVIKNNIRSRLQTFLEETGETISLEDMISIVEGVNASALAANDNSWLDMVGVERNEKLKLLLLELRKSYIQLNGPFTDAEPQIERIDLVREKMLEYDLDGLLVPRADEYQSEYLPACSERLKWLTGFDGSAAFAMILKSKAAIFTDGRYMLQIREQVDQNYFEIVNIADTSPIDWLKKLASDYDRIGFDPWLHTCYEIEQFTVGLKSKKIALVPLRVNPLDQLWTDRPLSPLAPIIPHPDVYSGESLSAKFNRMIDIMGENSEDAVIISSPESIAWLLNIRGSDVAKTPLPLSFLILHTRGKAELFVDQRKIITATKKHFGNLVSVFPTEEFGHSLDELVLQKNKIRLDPKFCPAWINSRIKTDASSISVGDDPTLILKAVKNETELRGARAAHKRDGAAFVRFLHWFSLNAVTEKLDEITVASKLEAFRAEDRLFRGLSFDTISGSGPNGAIVHYRVTEKSNRQIKLRDLYLVDSGAQYLDGTTDITRTIAVGDPGDEARNYFTRVLKGHIALATSKFPRGTTGSQLDALARMPLWAAGVDYDHGTGHGVGSYLGVHEGPQRISKSPNAVQLQPGMIISNEPGFYKEGAYGIRLENLVIVQPETIENSNLEMLSFETITLAPFDITMINTSLLTDDEVQWLNAYHLRVRRELTPLLDSKDSDWLLKATLEIK